jgi:SAM-dependent methyltransferase
MGVFHSYLQGPFRRTGVYQRLRASRLYDVYWSVANSRIIDERDREVASYRNILRGFRKGDLIYDVGANHGYKTDIFLRLGAKVIAIDPDELNQEILRQKFLSYRLRKKPVIVVGKAVSNQTSVQTMWIDEPGSAKNTLNKKWAQTLRGDASRFGAKLAFAQE